MALGETGGVSGLLFVKEKDNEGQEIGIGQTFQESFGLA